MACLKIFKIYFDKFHHTVSAANQNYYVMSSYASFKLEHAQW